MSDDLAQEVLTILRSKLNRAEQVTELVALLGAPGETVYEAWPRRTSVRVEQVEAYGLILDLDANGEACRIEFPYGAEVSADD